MGHRSRRRFSAVRLSTPRPFRRLAGVVLAMGLLVGLVIAAPAGSAGKQPGATARPASGATPVVATAGASVTAAHPEQRDVSRTLLRAGGAPKWRSYLRFQVAPGQRVARATLGLWAVRRPRGRLTVHTVRPRQPGRYWREAHVTYSRAPRLDRAVGGWRAKARCPRSKCAERQWVWIDVTRAIGKGGRLDLAVTGSAKVPLQFAGRRDTAHAPRLLVERDVAASRVVAPAAPPPAAQPAAPVAVSASSVPCTGSAPPARWRHVVWIWMENKDYSQIMGASASPYTAALSGQCGLATNSHGIAHPSLPNYIAAVSGGQQGVTDNGDPSAHPLTAPSIFQQLGTDWVSYQHNMSSPCQQTGSKGYVPRHNPALYFTPVGPACQTQNVPLPPNPSFDAAFTFVMPDLCSSMHDCPVAVGDAWLQGIVPQVLASPGYQAGETLLVITYDENDGSPNNHIATLLLAKSVVPGTVDATYYDHYSLLRTTQELLGLPLLGAAASATSMRAGFNLG